MDGDGTRPVCCRRWHAVAAVVMQCHVRARCAGAGAALGVAPPGIEKPGGSGMGEQLIRAFAAQLDGVLSAEEDAERHVVRLRFPIGSFVQETA